MTNICDLCDQRLSYETLQWAEIRIDCPYDLAVTERCGVTFCVECAKILRERSISTVVRHGVRSLKGVTDDSSL